ncbi:MAG: protein kinase, partial [Planctomycetaceae bacterium]|nr:protein kinase [Planctomycetaceae bacterium]
MNTLDAYQLPPDIFAEARTTCCEATGPDNTVVRVTVFSQALSDNPRFRAALRYHAPTLLGIHHFHILKTVQWGEADGRMYLVSETPEGEPLQDGSLCDLEWDQIIDIAWQITSAVQHAHNLGLAHGDLTGRRVFVSPQIRVQVEGFGLGHWLFEADEPAAQDAFHLQRRDVQQLVMMLSALIPLAAEQDQPLLQEYRSLLEQLQANPEEHTARDVQRQLGQLLLRETEDEIEMIDQRTGISHTGR